MCVLFLCVVCVCVCVCMFDVGASLVQKRTSAHEKVLTRTCAREGVLAVAQEVRERARESERDLAVVLDIEGGTKVVA
jgi:hypothetical protein